MYSKFVYLCRLIYPKMKNRIRLFVNCLVCSMLFLVPGYSQPLVIMHTNDTHSQIDPYSKHEDVNVGGFLRRDAAIREIRAENPYTLLFDAGDFSQGTPYFNIFKGYVEVRLIFFCVDKTAQFIPPCSSRFLQASKKAWPHTTIARRGVVVPWTFATGLDTIYTAPLSNSDKEHQIQ